MKNLLLILLLSPVLLLGQFDIKVYQDSLKNTAYLKEYFQNNKEYTDSSYALYLTKKAPIDSFEVDSTGGFGFKPTSLTISYDSVLYLKFYVGLSIKDDKNGNLEELSFHNHAGIKTALTWKFYKKGGIYKIIKYPEEKIDTVSHFGALVTEPTTYSFQQFRKSGSIELMGAYKDDVKDGNWFYFDKKGIMNRKEKFKDGKRVSKVSF